ncbi:hypothetical protein SAMN04488550_4443 [Gordonia malaquae]|jgi:hypothetical protein|nr:hypothetical protein [Gordonia malaquae]SEE38889.1 hypothetical protein SAMN04488550_4443 [Gordonia malaquae]
MQSSRQRRRPSFIDFVRNLSGRRRNASALTEGSERLATTAELMALRVGR